MAWAAQAGIFFSPTNGTWQMSDGYAEASSPESAWRQAAFDDSAWLTAPGPFYYSVSATEPPFYTGGSFSGTVVSGMRYNYTCLFLRKEFIVTNLAAAGRLFLDAAGDDGLIAWINGVEVARTNMPSGEVPFSGVALANVLEPVPITRYTLTNPAAFLLPGTNVLAVQAFNATKANFDFGFMAGLWSPPAVADLAPAAGLRVGALTQIDVTFSEPVTGVNAGDLLINGTPGSSLATNGPNRYLFSFPQPIPGAVSIAWESNHGISNASAGAFLGGNWSYTLDTSYVLPEAIISEFMAANRSTLADEDGAFSDWIEIFNPSFTAMNLGGWFLTDDIRVLDKWQFPATNLPAGGRLIVFASGKDRRSAGLPMHANFKLNGDGEYLALVKPDGLTVVSSFAPAFPAQRADLSYGLVNGTGTNGFLLAATPGTLNVSMAAQFVADTKFSHDRGFYSTNFSLVITCDTPEAAIYFTTNGSPPSAQNGMLYVAPIPVSRTTVVRAHAERTGFHPSNVDTHTYIFLADVLTQSPNGSSPPGWPSSWGANVVDYGMDPDIVSRAPWNGTISNDLRTVPTISLVMSLEDLFDPDTGIYANPAGEGRLWERPSSLELIYPDARAGFQVEAGARIRGGFSRSTDNPKHSLRFLFRDEYGDAKLKFKLFGPTGASEFDAFDLRTAQDGSWAFQGDPNGLFLNDSFARDTLLAMGQPTERGDWYHLYINGQYWGIYNTCERPEADYAASYLGGAPEDYDVLKPDPGAGYDVVVTEGNDGAWQRLWQAATNGFANNADYFRVQGCNPDGSPNPAYENLLDVVNLVDYMLVVFWTGNSDGPIYVSGNFPNNFYAIRSRQNTAGFRFLSHDAEMNIYNLNDNRVETTTIGDPEAGDGPERSNPQYLWTRLLANTEFKVLFADRVQEHFFGSGALTTDACTARFLGRKVEIDRAIVGESARWGDAQRPSSPITRDDWLAAIDDKMTNYFPYRSAVVREQLRGMGLLPALGAPEFSHPGGAVSAGFELTITHTNSGGTVFFTQDGSDPRVPGGAVAPSAQAYTVPIAINTPVPIRARVFNGGEWSAFVEAIFYPPQDLGKLTVTEIMYHAPDVGPTSGDEFDFIELKNAGTTNLNLSGLTFTAGITFTFAGGAMLAPGQFFVLGRNVAALGAKYPGLTVNGVFSGKLDNGGETLTLSHPLGGAILSVTYDDVAPWPVAPDGFGFSLVPKTPGASQAPDKGSSWRASFSVGGSPGTEDPAPVLPAVVINEILAHTDPPQLDAIELYNPTGASADIGGWFLTDDPALPRKYRIASGTTLLPGACLAFDADDFNSTPGSGNRFALSSTGDDVYLFSGNAATNLTGYSHGVAFGASFNGVSFGRHVNSAGEEGFPLQSSRTLGFPNAGPQVGPIVINEINYHPDTNSDEFVELLNLAGTNAPLYAALFPTNTWKFGGLGYTFPTNITLNPGHMLLLVATNPASFRAKYNVPSGVQILGPVPGVLQDSGERLELQAPDTPNTSAVPYVTVEEVRYNDKAPWPPGANSSGLSLRRIIAAGFGNEPTNWIAGAPTPGYLDTGASTDSDGDGLPNAWETANGTNWILPDANDDPDHDGMTNWQEFLSGTAPNDPNSCLKILRVTANPGSIRLEFLAVSNHAYSVLYRPTEGGAWSKLADAPAHPTNRLETLTDSSPGDESRYYRLVTPTRP